MIKKQKNTENLLSRESIFIALMELMKIKRFDDISVTEIAHRAGVSRMAYYRNFTDKKEILNAYLDSLFETYWDQIINKPKNDYQSACLYFDYFRRNKEFLINLIQSGLSMIILDRHDQYLKIIFNDLYTINLTKTEQDYTVQFLSGGLFKLLIAWVENNMFEENELMAQIAVNLMKLHN